MTFEEFLSGRLADLVRFAVVLCGHRATAEQLVADAVLHVYDRRVRVDDPQNATAELRVWIVRGYLSEGMRLGAGAATDVDRPIVDASQANDDWDDLTGRFITSSKLQRTLAALRYYAGLDVDATALVMGSTPDGVALYLQRVLRDLNARADDGSGVEEAGTNSETDIRDLLALYGDDVDPDVAQLTVRLRDRLPDGELEERHRLAREAERVEAERLKAERVEAERIEAERIEAERIEAERIGAEPGEAERLKAERVEAERVAVGRPEAEGAVEARRNADRVEAERVEKERVEAERVEAERVEAERAEAAQAEVERLQAERDDAERLEIERLEAAHAEAERLTAEREIEPRAEIEQVATEPAEAVQIAAEHGGSEPSTDEHRDGGSSESNALDTRSASATLAQPGADDIQNEAGQSTDPDAALLESLDGPVDQGKSASGDVAGPAEAGRSATHRDLELPRLTRVLDPFTVAARKSKARKGTTRPGIADKTAPATKLGPAVKAGTAKARRARAGTAEAGTAEAGTAEAGTAEAGTAKAGTAKARRAKARRAEAAAARQKATAAAAGTATDPSAAQRLGRAPGSIGVEQAAGAASEPRGRSMNRATLLVGIVVMIVLIVVGIAVIASAA